MAKISTVQTLESLITYLNESLSWPVSIDDLDALTYDYTPDEVGIADTSAVKINRILRFRPFEATQPWSIFYIQFDAGSLPIVVLRRILNNLIVKQRAGTKDQQRWRMHDLLFIANYGSADDRTLSFAHFTEAPDRTGMPTLRVLGWDSDDTTLRLDDIERRLNTYLTYPEGSLNDWPQRWQAAFTLRPREVIKTSQELSKHLARLARAIRDRLTTVMQYESDKGPFTLLMKSFQSALIHDLKPEDFADMYAQTIAYGLLSTRIADPKKTSVDDFSLTLQTNPFLRDLLTTFLRMGGRDTGGSGIDFDELGIQEVGELLDQANMTEVLRDFGNRNADEDPVIHFYELFLKEYDAKKRMQRGVFYTPKPVVGYIVRSVHELLQTEFGLVDGLAATETWADMQQRMPKLMLPPQAVYIDGPSDERIDPQTPFVQILDPATGTGTFLVEVIDIIYNTLMQKWANLSDAKRRNAWNDYVPTHLLPRLYGYELMMAPYTIAHLKIGLKLLETGYTFGSDQRANIYLTNTLEPAQTQLALAGITPALAHEASAVNAVKLYKRFTVVVGNPPYSGHSNNNSTWIQGLIDGYSRINGISLNEANSKWLRDDYVKFIRFAQEMFRATNSGVFSYITNHGFIDNPTFRGMRHSLISDFAKMWITDLHGNSKKKERDDSGDNDENVFDIQQGVAIIAAVYDNSIIPLVCHGDIHGNRTFKYKSLENNSILNLVSEVFQPVKKHYLLKPQDLNAITEYSSYLELTSHSLESSLGILTKRDSLVIDFTPEELINKLHRFTDLNRTDQEVSDEFSIPLFDKDKWNLSSTRRYLASFSEKKIRPVLYRPFDVRYVYYDDQIVARTNRRVMKHLEAEFDNIALIFGRQGMATGSDLWDVCFITSVISDQNIFRRGGGTVFPLNQNITNNVTGNLEVSTNFSISFNEMTSGFTSNISLFHYAYSVFHSIAFRKRYSEFLSLDYPRLPITANLTLYKLLAQLGKDLSDLHLMKAINFPAGDSYFQGEVNIPIEKVIWKDNKVWVDKKQSIGFTGVPEEVWNFHIGGYQVCEKWLKDRKGRVLSDEDIAHYQKIVVALKETIRLMAEIDVVIDAHGGWPGAFASGVETSSEPVRPQFGQGTNSGTPKRRAAEESLPLNFADDE